ncbi:MAG: hypothetical protein QOJ75_2434 [Chloroflexota bacterium]|jgi:sugar lactone lactonase YvrE|nr:hypothetical protein [Chloroflexota bacterium]
MKLRFAFALGLMVALTLAIAPVAGTTSLPTRIDLPNGFQPEGITSGFHGRLYVGSLADGAIWRGSARTGQGRILVAGVTGQAAAGIHIDRQRRLWVAGANNHTIRVYNAVTGRLLQTYTFPTAGFINDLVITNNAVYATDSNNQQLAVVPLRQGGGLPAPSKARLLPLTGDYVVGTGFNANGIVARDGWLIIVQSNTGKLFRIDRTTGATKAIDTAGYSVANGDGLAQHNGMLYVVRNVDNRVAVLNLGSDLLSASLVGEITSAGNLDVPTTATFALDKLWVVNARFTTTPTPTTPYWITRLPLLP